MSAPEVQGGCLCGAVHWAAAGSLRPVIVCHCRECRAWSGHAWAATAVPLDRFRLLRDDGLRWVRVSDKASRGFCGGCGASLFWQPDAGGPDGAAPISIAAGSIDAPSGLQVAEHWYPEEAGDYYRPEGPPPPATAITGRVEAACMCRACRFTLPAPAGAVTACHCGQCRRLSGHYAASVDVDESAVEWQGGTVAQVHTSGGGTRGFCADCGSGLWFRAGDGAFSVEAGCLLAPTGARLVGHIFTDARGDYYTLDDGLPQSPGP